MSIAAAADADALLLHAPRADGAAAPCRTDQWNGQHAGSARADLGDDEKLRSCALTAVNCRLVDRKQYNDRLEIIKHFVRD